MPGLVISLKPNEKFLINGALLCNGPKRSQLRVCGNDSLVLRLSDALHPKDVDSPLKRVYFKAQLILSGDDPLADIKPELLSDLEALVAVFKDTPIIRVLEKSIIAVRRDRIYSFLTILRSLFVIERELLDQANVEHIKSQEISTPTHSDGEILGPGLKSALVG